MSDNGELERISSQLETIGEQLSIVKHQVSYVYDGDFRSEWRNGCTWGLVRVEAKDEDLLAVGIDPTPREIEGKCGDEHGPRDYECFESLDYPGEYRYSCRFDSNVHVRYHPCFYLSPMRAAKVNSYRAQKYLDTGGTLEQAEQSEGCYGFEPKFVAAVRAEARTRAADSAAEPGKDRTAEAGPESGERPAAQARLDLMFAQTWFNDNCNFAWLRAKLDGLSVFLIVASIGTIASDLRTGLVFGLAAWIVVSLLARSMKNRVAKASEQTVDDAARAAGFEGSFSREAHEIAISHLYGGYRKSAKK